MYIIIVGAGKIGIALAKLFLEEEHEVLIIENNEDKAQKIADDLDIVTISDDATKEGILDKANAYEADALIALTNSDEVNLIIGMLAKEKGVKKVAIRLAKTNYDDVILKKMGVDIAIYPEIAAAAYIEEIILKPAVLDLAFLSHGNAEITEMIIDDNSPYLNQIISKINTSNQRVVGKYDDNKLTFPKDNVKLKKGDKILLLITKENKS